MLQQILRDMYIDPELLAELSEDQKQVLFVKMREEQVRRWKEREKNLDEADKGKPRKPPKPGKKHVQFMKGRDGCDWVWVMGDHPNDKSIEQILEEEAQETAQQQAEKEMEEFQKKEEREMASLKKKMEEQKQRLEREKARMEEELRRKREEAELYQSLKEARIAAQKIEEERKQKEKEEKDKLEELKKIQAVQRRKSLERCDDIKHRRSSEIYIKWKEMREQLKKTAEASSKEVEERWQEQEKKSREAEQRMREIARTARLEYQESLRRTSNLIKAAKAFGSLSSPSDRPPVPPKKHLMQGTSSSIDRRKTKSRPPRPPNREAVAEWFSSEEKPRGAGLDPNTGKVAVWFHGIITRDDAEKLLQDQNVGSFLVRVSERVWGYTISYRDKERCKHFLIDTSEDGYQFFGANQVQHSKLSDLIAFHKETPITISGVEKLLTPVGQTSESADYGALFCNRRTESTSL